MKLLRYGPAGQEKAGALDAQGRMRDLSLLVPDLTPEWLAPERLRALTAIDLQKLPLVDESVRIGVPVAGSRQFVAIGLNYRKHAEEAGMEIPKEPVIFTKAITSLSGPNDDIVLPDGAQEGDWEIELGLIIGTKAQKVPVEKALEHVAGYCLANDVSERNWQAKRGGQWSKGKSFDTFGPIGPWLVTTDEIPDPQVLEMELKVNGETRQKSTTADMIFPVAQIVSHLSQFMTLLPGDVIITGTPSGVGLGMKPQQFLKKGDVITLRMDQLGAQTQKVV
ncbi:fumarylacetoacetate hydrolase family protein [Pusillimonas noertemannii]|uniref:2-keto-4-pentenoate hydratase/2-oxohepta-3-ene-1,7-dioic acid hydratase in catechol pathway n=1 Tax=Pusillimonas noertemannii TaxID=305977 RepID=A0A2U1CHM2_9BURK|nr:fumarylacetoacetate hydrolase family protein [Pusillimonas noertemannii]NYT70263.1 fumarylacetoacetate hydrolase family protein [Pusillimonas noertemannii]PVY60406.1 2-keto-4-pentenoate hydratase/2-oxohepta-3-ene-1,7-dioic acid hydratase in catechol pathway [Pusillimonas noertemannii]TFL08095.1 FAA hydrolase family protein [Pusillimonas noertemannii]